MRITGVRRTALLSLAAAWGACAQGPPIDWKAQQAETLARFRALVQIDSSSPAGNETKVVDYLKGALAEAGIPAQVFAQDPARANLVARIPGNGKKRPVLLLAHTDVVAVQREKWPMDPFAAIVKDGYVWGRGTTDDKDKLVSNLMLMLLMKRSGVRLDRDIIFLAESGEESATEVGIDFMVEKHFDAIDAEFALTEGGSVTIEGGKATAVTVSTTEKLPRRARLVATGTSGHGSIPRLDNAVVHLSAAVAKVSAWVTPLSLNETTRAYFERLAAISPPVRAARYRALLNPHHPASVERYLAANEQQRYSMLRTSVVPTIVKGGFQANVIPSEAEATLDIRMTPGEDAAKFFEAMAKVIDDPSVKIVPNTSAKRPAGPPSGLNTDMFRALEAVSKQMYPGAATLPMMMTGATDMAELRAKGMQCYGIGPESTDEEFAAHGWHSDVERATASSIYKLAEFTWKAVMEVAAPK
jgi:acetylornithine deacetylase/succinyl-diaminopimelate desuccinylase-like protein